jgi:hypothetical protein
MTRAASRLCRGLLLGAAAGLAPPIAAQVPAVDPYTNGDPGVMVTAGVVRYAPLLWSGPVTTKTVDGVLGAGRVLWLETAHFRIGSALEAMAVPDTAEKRHRLQDALRRLGKVLPRVDASSKRVDPWLRLHLYAQQAEELYADFQRRMGIDGSEFTGAAAPNGPFLGLPDKFLLLLVQKKSDLARYLQRFCPREGDGRARGFESERTYRCWLPKTGQVIVAAAIEGPENMDDTGLQCFVAFSLVRAFLDGYRGFHHPLPAWFCQGLAQWYARKVPTDFINADAAGAVDVDPLKQHLWRERVCLRAQHDSTWLRAEQLFALQEDGQFDYDACVMSWSRVDFLMAQGEDKVGTFLQRLKHLPEQGADGPFEEVQQEQTVALGELFGLDARTFDARWRQWVLKTYPKK